MAKGEQKDKDDSPIPEPPNPTSRSSAHHPESRRRVHEPGVLDFSARRLAKAKDLLLVVRFFGGRGRATVEDEPDSVLEPFERADFPLTAHLDERGRRGKLSALLLPLGRPLADPSSLSAEGDLLALD